jgi:hypothetical protein
MKTMALEKVEKGEGYTLYEDDTILLKNVRLSFPHIATSYKGKDDSFGFKLMLNKETQKEMATFLKKRIRILFDELKVKKLPPDKLFMRDGDESERESEHGHYVLSGNSKRPLAAIDRNSRKMTDKDQIDETFYAGCYVNAVIKLWAQNDKEYGKRVNAYANAIQFIRDGEPLGNQFNTDNYDWDVADDSEVDLDEDAMF